MKPFAATIAISSILLCLLSCDAGKSGPFTFANETSQAVNVIINQDGTVDKTLGVGEKYIGKDYYTPQTTFVRGFTANDRAVMDNRFAATTTNGFDYKFVAAAGTPLNVSATASPDFFTANPDYASWYVAEAAGKLGDYSDTRIPFSQLFTESQQAQGGMTVTVYVPTLATGTLYTSGPGFRVYRDKTTAAGTTEREDLTGLFTLSLGKSVIPPATATADATPTIQWNLVITYPKVQQVE